METKEDIASWLQQIFIHRVNGRILVEILIKDYQIVNVIDADASSTTLPKSHCVWIHTLSIFLQQHSRPSPVLKISLHSSERICPVCWMLCTALYGSTSLQQSSKGSCSLLVSGYNLRADCQWRTLVPPLNSGANAAPASVLALM